MNQTVTLSSIISIGSVGQPGGLFTDPSGALYCADTSTNSIIQINNYDSNAGLAKTKKKFAPPNPDDPLTMEPTPPVVITPAAPDSCIDTPKGELTVKWINSPTGTFLTTREIRTSKVELREVDGKSSLVCGPVTISAYATADCSGLPLSQTSTLKSVAKIINPVGEVSFSGFQITLPGTYYFVVSGFGLSNINLRIFFAL